MKNPNPLVLLLPLAIALHSGCAKHPTPPNTSEIKSSPLLEPLPAPARLAIQREVQDGSISRVTTDEFLGRTVYSVLFRTTSGKDAEIQVTSDGRTVFKNIAQDTIPFSNVPPPVRSAAISQTGGILPRNVQLRSLADRDAYTFEVRIADAQHRLTFDSAGSLLRQEYRIRDNQVPPRVNAALWQRFPGLKTSSISEVREGSLLYYTFTGSSNNRDIEANILPDGSFRSVYTR